MNSAERLSVYLDRSLASLPGDFARVVYLASLRDAYSGRYVHEGLVTVAAPEEVHSVLRQRHLEAFTSASSLPLDDLCRELEDHFAAMGKVPRELAKMWLELEPFRDIFPEGSTELERGFFLSQMRAALKVVAAALTMGVRLERDAWQPQ